ncbi:MAG: NADPH-dependent 2,4-dienoyl-CoA reductase [Saprospiraceae bacterium]|nr:NADPH-dependent 2,4-dienoyl-CoA reductase [Saprospiraceae bacterium]
MKFQHVFTPLDLGFMTLPNRFVMGSMHTNLEEIEGGFDRAAVFYKERAEGGVGLIITGGISPNEEGCVAPHAAKLTTEEEVQKHGVITRAVHDAGGKICMQILHTGRYGFHKNIVAPSPIQAPVNFFTPKEMTHEDILRTINDFAHCALMAQKAGYDGIEIMGSEGYLINQFLVTRTNIRSDEWGGTYEKRMAFPLAIVKKIKEKVGEQFLIIFRISMLDLVENGSSWSEIVQLAKTLETKGVHILNTGIGWHEARIPTIASSVPRMAYAWVTKKMKEHVSVPLIAVNRINMPDIAEKIVAEGYADMVSMARPFLADASLVHKAMIGRDDLINTCIACNQACLDHTFSLKISSCLVNPRACHETEIKIMPVDQPKRLAVIGGGPAGLAFSATAAKRGHSVYLYEASSSLGGQFNLAKVVPGKEEYGETIRYFTNELKEEKVTVYLNHPVNETNFSPLDFDAVIVAAGVKPRIPEIKGIDHNMVIRYDQLLSGEKKAGKKVVILGAGGIGFDVAEYLLKESHVDDEAEISKFLDEWGIDASYKERGGMMLLQPVTPQREIYLLKRSPGKHGNTLGKTTGWIKKIYLNQQNVKMLGHLQYEEITDKGIWISQGEIKTFIEADTIVLCTGQESFVEKFDTLRQQSKDWYVIGGAFEASELDAKKAIHQAVTLAAEI